MPRVNLGATPQQKMQAAEKRHDKRVLSIFRQGMARREYNLMMLSEATLIPYARVCRLMNGSVVMDIWSATRIADALGLDDDVRAALCGGTKCKYD